MHYFIKCMYRGNIRCEAKLHVPCFFIGNIDQVGKEDILNETLHIG